MHIAYTLGTTLFVASEETPGTFVTSTITETRPAWVEGPFALAVDAAGTEHVAYAVTRFPHEELWYASREPSGTWAREMVETLPYRQVQAPQIRVEGGHVHIVYQSLRGTTPTEIRHAEKSAPGGTWSPSFVAKGYAPSLALDPGGAPHIGFYEGESLLHAFRASPGAWGTEVAATTEYPYALTHTSPRLMSAIAVDASGGVHLAFSDSGYYQSKLRYARKTAGGAFEVAMLRDGRVLDATFSTPSFSIDSSGAAHLVYSAGETRDLRYYGGQVSF